VAAREAAHGVEQRRDLQKGTVADWVVEGYKIARAKVYKDKGVALPTDREAPGIHYRRITSWRARWWSKTG
jgi:hypothetical protein